MFPHIPHLVWHINGPLKSYFQSTQAQFSSFSPQLHDEHPNLFGSRIEPAPWSGLFVAFIYRPLLRYWAFLPFYFLTLFSWKQSVLKCSLTLSILEKEFQSFRICLQCCDLDSSCGAKELQERVSTYSQYKGSAIHYPRLQMLIFWDRFWIQVEKYLDIPLSFQSQLFLTRFPSRTFFEALIFVYSYKIFEAEGLSRLF